MRRRPLLAIGTLAGFAFAIWLPVDRYVDNQRAIGVLRAEESRLAAELAERQHDVVDALGPVETEALARRRLGMVRPGERLFVVPQPEAQPELPPVPEPEAAATDPWWSRSAGALFRVMRSLI